MKICVIGPGRLGSPLALRLRACGHLVTALGRAETAAGGHGDLSRFDLAFITIPDQDITALAGQIIKFPQAGLIHCAGGMRNAAIAPGAGTFHPLMSFTGQESADIFDGCPIGISAPAPLADILRNLAVELGGIPFVITEDQKSRYHLAGMFASVLPLLLLLKAQDLLAETGLPMDEAGAILAPIYKKAADNLVESGRGAGITGPVSRKDTETICRHLDILAGDPETQQLYRQLTRLALEYVPMDGETQNKFRSIISTFQLDEVRIQPK